jgi:hypothetical protein
MITLGIVLLIIGLLAPMQLLVTVGGILIVVGLVLAILGGVGRPIGGRKFYW